MQSNFTYKIRNWKQYNQALVNRGSLTVWWDIQAAAKWYQKENGKKKRGGQTIYSDHAIEVGLTMRMVFGLGFRQLEGFLTSIVTWMKLDLEIPDFSTFNRRQKNMYGMNLHKRHKKGHLDVVIDSSGLKVYGEGEWKVRQHGWSKRRTWRKLHIAMDPNTKEALSCRLTFRDKDDAKMTEDLLLDVQGKIRNLYGDGSYDDNENVYSVLEYLKISGVIPPRIDAVIHKHGNCNGPPLPRDEAIRYIRRHGRKAWKNMSGYHRRSLVENFFYRYKTVLGGKLRSREEDRQMSEAVLGCKVLNRMARLGMPDSYKVIKIA